MTKNRIKRKKAGIIWLIFTLVWMVVIFSFSAREADESAAMSHSVGKMIGRLVIPEYRSWSEDKQGQFAEKVDFPVRKCAHASEYAVLGILVLGTAYSFSETGEERSYCCAGVLVQHMPERMNHISCLCRAGAASSETYVLTVPVC